MLFRLVMVAAMLGLATPAAAHPHVFVDTVFSFVFDGQGRLSAIRLGWRYDALYSLLLTEDNDLDAGDATPDPARLAGFACHDVDWAGGFAGDFTLEIDRSRVPLGPPTDCRALWNGDQIISVHTRTLPEPVAVAGHEVVARAYDPSFFKDYEVPVDPLVTGRDDCTVRRTPADTESAQRDYGAMLSALDRPQGPLIGAVAPQVGLFYADRFSLTCPPLR